ncbi:unnamed protein product [Schistocephalus solidus]|uniref:LIM zinc-binding domain-containing protein n=1 Tax=Schistocephalus solidus TaxID=70667 RepID=A0A183T8P3_SCHSO|nr:unnamed protein product [Schistocephalus solidus]
MFYFCLDIMSSCEKCSKPLSEGQVVTAAGKKIHTDCFVCTQCKGKLVGVKFRSKDCGTYCESCYTEKFHCEKCSKPLSEGQVVTAAGKKIHTDCFVCTQCKGKLVGVKFRSKDCGTYCESCYTEKFQPKCAVRFSLYLYAYS